MQIFDFELIKSVCIYFSKINNKSKKINKKTQKLKKLLYENLSIIDFKFCDEITTRYTCEEIINIIIKLISLKDITLDTINKFKVVQSNNDNHSFIYAQCDDLIIKIGRYSDLSKDDFREYHDTSMSNIYVNTVIPKINLSYNNSLGDSNISEKLKCTSESLCKILPKEKSLKK